jgi:hypothetical protein
MRQDYLGAPEEDYYHDNGSLAIHRMSQLVAVKIRYFYNTKEVATKHV